MYTLFIDLIKYSNQQIPKYLSLSYKDPCKVPKEPILLITSEMHGIRNKSIKWSSLNVKEQKQSEIKWWK